ncbi:MAG: RagB/SusD family nutrient uptake outer membrane protein [Pedobacter sp.]|jgi:hypothetical protein|uniref:RagB/SusD family nutrient uptake outer membrane protein n=1 Tax=Pedobacter sp. TaxID=1411316 RepID=UPI003566B584
MKNTFIKTVLISGMCLVMACKGFLEIDAPKDQIIASKIYTNDETATAVIRGIYAQLISNSMFASGNQLSITFLAGRSADDFVNYSGNASYKQFYDNNILPDNASLRSSLWQSPYQIIYAANAVLENLILSDQVSQPVKQQLLGEAKFIRAFCHFYLTNLFGDVPLVLTTDYKANILAFASTKARLYEQMIRDLTEAKNQLSDGYPSTERVRVNKWAAVALLSRVYLYHKDWAKAESEASEIIGRTNQYELLGDLNQVFLKNSKEAILQFVVPAGLGSNTFEGKRFILNAAPNVSTEVVLSDQLLSAFGPGDERQLKWVGTFTIGANSWKYPFKYKVKSSANSEEYSMVLRLAEQYLIRAEARINQEKIDLGIEDLNALRRRARALPTIAVSSPLPDLPADMDKATALLAVEDERRVEFFSEWGHRWLDLKRTNRANTILAPLKGSKWQNTDVLYPIPVTELLNNKNLVQNLGYH